MTSSFQILLIKPDKLLISQIFIFRVYKLSVYGNHNFIYLYIYKDKYVLNNITNIQIEGFVYVFVKCIHAMSIQINVPQ